MDFKPLKWINIHIKQYLSTIEAIKLYSSSIPKICYGIDQQKF